MSHHPIKKNTAFFEKTKCAKNLMRQGVVAFCYPYYSTAENVEVVPELKEDLKSSPENDGVIISDKHRFQEFSKEQYESICKICSIILTCKYKLGSENLLVGGIFVPTNKSMETSFSTCTRSISEKEKIKLFLPMILVSYL